MPILAQIGRKSWGTRLVVWSIYALLSAGAITMIYPFLMMMSLSVASDADAKENRLVPRYFYSEDALFRKFAEIKYNEIDIFNRRHWSAYGEFGYGGDFRSVSRTAVNFPYIAAAPFDLSDARIEARVDDYREWKRQWIERHWVFTRVLYNTNRSRATINTVLDRYVSFLLAKYKSLDGINEAYYEENRNLSEIYLIMEQPTYRTYLPGVGVKFDDWQAFKEKLLAEDAEFISIPDIQGEWAAVLAAKYGNIESLNAALGSDYKCFYGVPLSFAVPPPGAGGAAAIRELWVDFARNTCPLRYMSIANADSKWRDFLKARYAGVAAVNAAHESRAVSFDEITFPSDISYNKRLTNDIYAFVGSDSFAPEDITIRGPRWYWMDYLRSKYGSLDAANAAHSIAYTDWSAVKLPCRLPLGHTEAEQADWRQFVVAVCPIDGLLANFPSKAVAAYLSSEYGEVTKLNAAWGTSWRAFDKAKAPRPGAVTAGQEKDLRAMLRDEAVPLFGVTIGKSVPDGAYQSFLRTRYASIADYDNAIRLYPSWEAVSEPVEEVEWADFQAKRNSFVREFLTGNYKAVADYMAIHGTAFLNTVILCAAMIISALTVNPLCAYALSRFQMSYAASILLFLLATMAFPGAVTQIPNFLLLKEMNLLNTYWALILPGLANGFSIFLLKGFFDSLPQELFEAGLIDGASEVQMFYRIALPLTKPILAVIALGAFTAAYGQFMWAFVVCQNPKFWTIMVFLYEFQAEHATPLVMAALVLASIPTLLVFIAAQKVILQGIVVPQMK